MPANLDFLGIVQCPNGPFIICYDCRSVVGAHGALQTHLRKTHGLPPLKAIPVEIYKKCSKVEMLDSFERLGG